MTLSAPIEKIIDKYKIAEVKLDIEGYKPNYNGAPSQQMAVVTESDAGRVLDCYRWGLVPHWADDPKIGYKMINARCETIAEKSSFKTLLKSKRCIIPADGFYEWKGEKKNKTPMHIHMKDGSVFGFAGLWSAWRPKGSEEPWLRTCTIITTAANELMEPIHNRMPVILPPDAVAEWLNPDLTEPEHLLHMLRPYESESMEANEVSRIVNTPAFNGPECIQPVHGSPPVPEVLVMNSE